MRVDSFYILHTCCFTGGLWLLCKYPGCKLDLHTHMIDLDCPLGTEDHYGLLWPFQYCKYHLPSGRVPVVVREQSYKDVLRSWMESLGELGDKLSLDVWTGHLKYTNSHNIAVVEDLTSWETLWAFSWEIYSAILRTATWKQISLRSMECTPRIVHTVFQPHFLIYFIYWGKMYILHFPCKCSRQFSLLHNKCNLYHNKKWKHQSD